MSQETLTRAWEVLQDAYQAQMEGDYDRAAELYQSSLELHPTAEAHTFLGWTYHYQGKLMDAIAECKRAIDATNRGIFLITISVARTSERKCMARRSAASRKRSRSNRVIRSLGKRWNRFAAWSIEFLDYFLFSNF